MLVDSSGSMYGASMQSVREAALRFAKKNLRPNRAVTLFAYPGNIKTRPTRQLTDLNTALYALIPIGCSPLHEGLAAARRSLKGKAGMQRVFIILSDGHTDDPEAAMAEAIRIRRSGGRIIAIGIGRQINQEFLQRLCMRPSDFHYSHDVIELDGTFINLATELSDLA